MGFKLNQISNFSRKKDYLEKNDEIFKRIYELVQLQQFSIDCFETLNKFINPILVLGVLAVIIGCSASGCLMVMKFNEDLNVAMKMGLIYSLCSEFLFVAAYPSQKIYDACNEIFDNCYCTDWYRYSIKNRKMIKLIMMRSSRHSCIRIGPSKILNYDMSRKIIQLSLSYIVSLMSIYKL
ncbi:uncharacterized protein LOC106652009 [Trichogramma pretiosum]|uniref:uncharacterized protein LOC106652009 n=1 Tax=Trichogramma pretiosum TaxID=7493 RepID=UPI000C718FD0|nr:uncharacterized protein LOC106652009 [Trichogramma pretiosum]